MADLFLNTSGRAEVSPDELASTGARGVRCVAYADYILTDWIAACQARGMRVLLVLASELLGDDPDQWLGPLAWAGKMSSSVI